MALKKKITKDEFAALSKELQKEYTAKGEDYLLDVEPSDDDDDDDEDNTGELRRARDREKADRLKAQRELKAARDRVAELENGRSRKDDDIDKLEKTWKEKQDAVEKDRDEKLAAANKRIADQLINGTANSIASKISTMPKLMAKEIRERLIVEFDEETGEPELIIRNNKGKNSDMTLEQLEKEFVANKEFAAIIIGSKASGGSAPRSGAERKPGGTGASEDKPPMLSKMTGKDLAAHIKQQKEANTDA